MLAGLLLSTLQVPGVPALELSCSCHNPCGLKCLTGPDVSSGQVLGDSMEPRTTAWRSAAILYVPGLHISLAVTYHECPVVQR